MPFKECSIVESRGEFCRLASMPGANKRELCRRFGVSPETGYKWLTRFAASGEAGLDDLSRRPLSSPLRTAEAIEARVLGVRQAHPAWGGRKIRKVLENEGLADVPSASTITAILARHGFLDGPRAGEPRDVQRFEHPEPNDLWQMDFKGHVAMAGGRCHPLTMLDDHSRYCLELGACADERTLTVRERMTSVFRRHGLPKRILADNGPPWGTSGSDQRHTPLTVWLLDLEVPISHGRPYHPQTQGKEERFHRSMKAEVLGERVFDSLAQAQAAFDAWRDVYNVKRPHEGIGMATPATRYRMSPRAMPETIGQPDYEPGAPTRKVDPGGWLTFQGRVVNCPKAFAGRRLALRATERDGVFDLCYRRHVISQVDLRQNMVIPVHHVPEHTSTLSPV
jgi:transposase InsO family protein